METAQLKQHTNEIFEYYLRNITWLSANYCQKYILWNNTTKTIESVHDSINEAEENGKIKFNDAIYFVFHCYYYAFFGFEPFVYKFNLDKCHLSNINTQQEETAL